MEPDYTTAFDALHTNNHIQKLKVLHAFSEPDIQHFMAVYIKFLELQYTLANHLKYQPFAGSVNTICDALCPFCTPREQKQLKQICGLMDSFETVRAVSETMELMKDIFPTDDLGTDSGQGTDPDSDPAVDSGMKQLLMGMLSEEQRLLFETLLKNNDRPHSK